MNYLAGIFFILHGLVHLLYMGHSLNYFELEKGFKWPDNSTFLTPVFSLKTNRLLAAAFCVVAAVSFILSGIFLLAGYSRVNQVIIVAVVTSSLLFIIFWDGTKKKLHTQGGIAILLNVLILVFYLNSAW